MPRTPPIPGPYCPLTDIQGYAYVRRKLVAPRHRHFLQLNGSVLSASATPNAPPEWEISVLHTTVHAIPRRNGFILTLSSNIKLYIYLQQNQQTPSLEQNHTQQQAQYHLSQLKHKSYSQQSDQNRQRFYTRRRHRHLSSQESRHHQLESQHVTHHSQQQQQQQQKNCFLVSDWVEAIQIAATRDFHARYRLQDQIGEGAFATVHRARCKITGQIVAVKCVRRSDFDHVTTRELQREMFAVKHLHHPNVVRGREVFNSLRDVHMVMDFMRGGTLKDVVQFLGGRVTETFAKHVMKQVLLACDFLHRNGYVHRDVKLENVLCENKVSEKGRFKVSKTYSQKRKEIKRVFINDNEDNDGDDGDDDDNKREQHARVCEQYEADVDKVKLRRKGHDEEDIAFVMKTMGKVRLADFGYVNFLNDFRHPCLSSLLGTPVYIAPEIIRKEKYGASVDIYAAGVMLYRMLSGHYPYDGRDDDDKTLRLAIKAELTFPDLAWRRTSKKCRSFVRALLQPLPDRRLTARTALLHPWLDDTKEDGGVNYVGGNEVEVDDNCDYVDIGDDVNALLTYEMDFAHGTLGNGASSPISPVSASASASVSGGSMAGEGDGAKTQQHSKVIGHVDWEESKKNGVTTYIHKKSYSSWCSAPFANAWSAPARHALHRVRVAARAASFIGKLATLSGIESYRSAMRRGNSMSTKVRLDDVNICYEDDCVDDDDDLYHDEDDELEEYEDEGDYDEEDEDEEYEEEEEGEYEDGEEVDGAVVGRRGLWYASGGKDLRRRSTRGSLAGLANRLARASSFSRPQPRGRTLRLGTIGDKLRRTMTLGRK